MKAIVFDLDGTLIHSAPSIHVAANRLLAAEGLSQLTFAQLQGFIGHGVGVLIERIMAAAGLPANPATHAKLQADFMQLYETAVDETVLYPGVADALTALQEDGWSMAICTNKPMGPTRFVLNHFGLLETFSVIFGGDSLPQRKPDPAPLLATIKALGASQALFVGDSEVDAETADRGGVPLALYTQGYRKTPVKDLPHLKAFDDFATLPQIAATWWAGIK